MRRRTLLSATVPLAAASAGCVGFLTGSEPLEEEATPARVSEAVLAETGYELDGADTREVRREVEFAGQTREVVAVNQVARYHRAFDVPLLGEVEAGVFATVATPAFEVAGETFNPVGDWSNRRLAGELQAQYSDLSVGEEVDAAAVSTLDAEMELSKFEGTATIQGQGIDVFVHVGSVRDGADFVVAVGIYPRQLPGEGSRVLAMAGGLTHE